MAGWLVIDAAQRAPLLLLAKNAIECVHSMLVLLLQQPPWASVLPTTVRQAAHIHPSSTEAASACDHM